MNDDELIERLKASATTPKDADDPAFWAAFEGDVRRARQKRPRWPAVTAVALAAAAALLFFVRPAPPPEPTRIDGGISHAAPMYDDDEDPTDLVGDLDFEQLRAVDDHFHGGV